jgi:NAD(P)-dependent dehydrogenase (short-subunit alcohol dehydrogenase family)
VEDLDDELRALGDGRAERVDHLEPDQVRDLVAGVERQHGRLDLLVVGLFGADLLTTFGTRLWEHDLDRGLRMLRIGIDGHLITCAVAGPLLARTPGALVVELTDGPSDYNRAYRSQVNLFYDLTKPAAERLVLGLAHDLAPTGTAVGVTPGWLRSEAMLDAFGVTEATWRDALVSQPHFAISETPSFVARGVAALAADPSRADSGGRVLTAFQLAERYDVVDLDGSRPDAWRYVVEVQDRGLPADVTGYR